MYTPPDTHLCINRENTTLSAKKTFLKIPGLPFNSYLQPMEKSNGSLSKGEFNLNGVLFYYELKLTRADDVLSNTNHNLFFNDKNGHVYLGYIKKAACNTNDIEEKIKKISRQRKWFV